MANEAITADHLRTTPPDLERAVLSDAQVAALSAPDLHVYFARCLRATDIDADHAPCMIEPPAPKLSRPVYFIQCGEGGPIKIGIARDPAKRLAGLQTGHFERLQLRALTTGGAKQERAYHDRFAAHRLHGEWFSPHPDLLAEIARLNEAETGPEHPHFSPQFRRRLVAP